MIVYKSEVMAQLVRTAERIAPSSVSTLILGEIGTGKEPSMNFWDMKTYQGINGQMIEVLPYGSGRRPKWQYHFVGSSLWFVGYKNKFDAILAASRHCRKSCEKLNWAPIEKGSKPV